MRRIFIGDIHGCRAELEELLETCRYDAGRDRLYPVGDLVHKGPDSEGVVRLLAKVDAQPVLGNHDLAAIERKSLRDAKLTKWLAKQPMVRVFDDLVLVHAGLHPDWGDRELERHCAQAPGYVANLRYCRSNGERPSVDWPPPGDPFAPWDHFYSGRRRVVFGHWARRGLVVSDQVIGLDTGCCYGGWLSAWIAEEDRVVQVRSRQPGR